MSEKDSAAAPEVVVRRDEYAGHAIVVTSTYAVTVDGVSVPLDLAVANDGSVGCPGLPGYRAASVTELVRRFLDTYPPDGPAVGGGPRDLGRVDDEGDMGGTGHTVHAAEG